MKDLHNHILFNIDDGSTSIDKSIEILNLLKTRGVTDIVATPHYIIGTNYNSNNKEKIKILNELQKNTDIKIYLGNEVYIDTGISNLLNTDISTINGSRYILIELPMNRKSTIIDDVLYELSKKNIIPIIAHPERYTSYYKDYEFFQDLIDKGCLLQGNIGSLYNKYGLKAKRMIKGLLKKRMISFMASDIHHDSSDLYSKNINKDLYKLLKDKDYIDNILENNARVIINSSKE